MRSIVYNEIAEAAENVTPRTGRAGLFAAVRALRDYVVRHPHRIPLLLENAEDAAGPLREASERLMRRVMDLLGGYGLSGASAVHAARLLRALWIGFALLETSGGYAMDVPVEESFTFALEAMHRSFAVKPGRPRR